MAENTAEKPTTTAKKTAKKGSSTNKMWLGGLIVIILVLGGVNFYYMKNNKELKEALAKKNDKGKSLEKQPTETNGATEGPTDGNDVDDVPNP